MVCLCFGARPRWGPRLLNSHIQHTQSFPQVDPSTKHNNRRIMGEPIIGSIVCGSVALVMMIWNWRMVEHQKWLGRKCAGQAAKEAQLRAHLRAHSQAKAAAFRADLAAAMCGSPSSAASKSSSSHCFKLESLPECDEGELESPEFGSPDMFIKGRDRFETAPMSPASALSSTRSRSGTAYFFTDGFDATSPAGHRTSLGF